MREVVNVSKKMRDSIVLGGRRVNRGNGDILFRKILLDMEGGRYVGPLLTATLEDLVSGR